MALPNSHVELLVAPKPTAGNRNGQEIPPAISGDCKKVPSWLVVRAAEDESRSNKAAAYAIPQHMPQISRPKAPGRRYSHTGRNGLMCDQAVPAAVSGTLYYRLQIGMHSPAENGRSLERPVSRVGHR